MKEVESKVFVAEINGLDEKGSGKAQVWRETEHGTKRKIKLTIPQTLPGEKVRVFVDNPERRRRRAVAEEILETHPERIGPECPHFDKCGGCVWQHWDYEGQLKQKTVHVKKAVEGQGFDSDLVLDAIGMDNPWH